MKNLMVFLSCLALSGGLLPKAEAKLCDSSKQSCGYWPGSSDPSTGAPTRGSKISINPAAVPTEKGTGIETIIFDGVDVALVRGMGRVGAGISPSASESIFFGPPSLELPEDYLERRIGAKKYESKKFTLATAFRVYDNKKSSLRQFDVNLGLLGKYNQLTRQVTGGAGLRGKIGPFTYGYSVYSDQTQLDYADYGLEEKPVTRFYVETISGGIFLKSAALDYSRLRMITNDVSTVGVFTASLLLKKTILTVAFRAEESAKPDYDSTTKTLQDRRKKSDTFLGAQVNVGRYLLAGLFYNYYTLDELSIGATVFF